MSSQTPSRPDSGGVPSPPPAPKNTAVKIVGIVVAGIVALGVVNAIAGDNPKIAAPAATTTVGTQTGDDSLNDFMTPKMLVDYMKKSAVREFCVGYDLIGNRDAALALFAEGYGDDAGRPTGEEVFDEMLSRC